MKNRILLTAAVAGFLLASCGIVRNNDFAARKYTNFHKGIADMTSKSVQQSSESLKQESEEIAGVSEATECPVIVSTTASDQTEARKLEIKVQEKVPLCSSVDLKKEKKEIKLRKLRDRVLARLVDKPNTTSLNSDQVVLVILAILVPPIAVYLVRGIGTEFWLSIIFWILGIVPGIIYALLVVFDAV